MLTPETRESNMTVQILLSTYNGQRFLDDQLKSIISQTIKDRGLLIRDDGSTDHTPQAADKLAAMDRRIHVIHQENQGIFKSYNTGYKAAAGEYAGKAAVGLPASLLCRRLDDGGGGLTGRFQVIYPLL